MHTVCRHSVHENTTHNSHVVNTEGHNEVLDYGIDVKQGLNHETEDKYNAKYLS